MDADVEMLVVTIDRANLAERRTVALPGVAKLLLDRRVDENSLHLRVARGLHHHAGMGIGPATWMHRQELALVEHRGARKSVVQETSVSVRVYLGGRSIIKKQLNIAYQRQPSLKRTKY